MIEMVRSIN